MSQHDRQLAPQTRPLSGGEVPFDPGELFYSRTDDRGIIAEGNQVFRRISGFGWSELKGAPHKLVRHPDMPKGVFYLFWDRLKSGKKMVAYVKNRTKDGRHYWVTALTWKIPEGYMSVRLKPTTDLRAEVEAIYKDLLNAEQNDGVTPEQSAERLLAKIAEMGFVDYDAFMAHALRTEMENTSKLVHMPLTPMQQRFFAMFDTISELGAEVEGLVEVIRAIRTVPMNMRILASRLESSGGPISAISVNYSQMLEEMSTWIKQFAEGPDCTFARIKSAIQQGQFLVCASSMQSSMSVYFEKDLAGAKDITALSQDKETLEREAHRFQTEAQESLKLIESEVRRLSRSVLDMKRYVTGLSSTRMMCKIESASLGDSDTALNGIVEQLDERQDEIERRLARVVELNSNIQGHSAMLRSMS
ncbi:chemotaxis protein [Sagittula sp. P11]|uniref:PAS domain-containing protein n=1 Tax=Sagittula sp. P11 TaxID=2009329 RepID=UPI000C2D2701|nr:PAS domain-containing protein [Sagittula sp. P11]AUC52524.1 chemotaxis protein [Sagittula sp. P11]